MEKLSRYRLTNVASGQRREQRAGGAEADGDPAARRRLAHPVPVHEHGHRDVGRAVPDDDVLAARHDERPRVERVRRDERRRHRVDPPHQHRPAVREVVGGRAGGRRADDPVARDAAEVLAADRPLELDHAAEHRRRDDDVVDGDVPVSPFSTSSVGSSTTSSSPRNARVRPTSSSSGCIELRNPTRPKLTPITGMPVPRNVRSARSIVPSPPRTTTRSASPGSPLASRPCRAASSGATMSSTPAAPATSSEPRDAVADLLLAPVRDERCPCNGLRAATRRRRRSGARAHRGRRASRSRSGGRRTPGSPSAPGGPESTTPATRARQRSRRRRRSRAGRGGALRDRGRRPSARRRAPPRTAA